MDKWVSEWPTEDGYYWFYGLVRNDTVKRLSIVRVMNKAMMMRPVYIMDGNFFYRSDVVEGEGCWLPMPTPKLPE